MDNAQKISQLNKTNRHDLLVYKKKLMPKKILEQGQIRSKLMSMYPNKHDIGRRD